MFYLVLKHIHSGFRWLVLVAIAMTLIQAFIKMLGRRKYNNRDKILATISASSLHLQFVTGLILYFASPKVIFSTQSMSNSLSRFFLLEHAILMIIAVVAITIGHRFIKKTENSGKKHLLTVLLYTSVLLLLFFSIPWPWKNYGGLWF